MGNFFIYLLDLNYKTNNVILYFTLTEVSLINLQVT